MIRHHLLGPPPLLLSCHSSCNSLVIQTPRKLYHTQDSLAMGPPSIIQLAKNGNVEQLKEQLLGEVDLNLRDELYGQTALSWASENGHLEVVKILLGKHAKIDIADDGGRLPLYWACSNEHNDIARVLLTSTTKPEDILYRDVYGRSALSYAAMCGAEDAIQRLLSTTPNIEIDSRDEEGLTPLMFALSHGHEEASTLLLNSNADPSVKDKEGRTALYHATSKGHVATMQILLKTNPDLIRSSGEYMIPLRYFIDTNN